MAKLNEILVQMVIPMVKAVGKLQLQELLDKIKEHNSEELYKNLLQSIYSSFKMLKDVTIKTKSKIDDGIVDLVLEAVEEQAEAASIELSVAAPPDENTNGNV